VTTAQGKRTSFSLVPLLPCAFHAFFLCCIPIQLFYKVFVDAVAFLLLYNDEK
jgi:hypothetical protein